MAPPLKKKIYLNYEVPETKDRKYAPKRRGIWECLGRGMGIWVHKVPEEARRVGAWVQGGGGAGPAGSCSCSGPGLRPQEAEGVAGWGWGKFQTAETVLSARTSLNKQ